MVSSDDQEAAVKQLCRIHDAGLIMETTSGIDVPNGCRSCTEARVRCRVWKDGRRVGCAFCLIDGRECTATTAAASREPPSRVIGPKAPTALPQAPRPATPSTNHFRDLEIEIFGRSRDARSTPPSSDAEAEFEAELRSFAKRQTTKQPAQATAKAKTKATTAVHAQGKAPVAPMVRTTAPVTKPSSVPIDEKVDAQSESEQAPTSPLRSQCNFVKESDSEPIRPQDPSQTMERHSPNHTRQESTSSDEPLIAQRQRRPQLGPRSESGYGSLQPPSPIAPASSAEDDSTTAPSTTKHPYPEVLGETSEWWKLSREAYEAMSDHVKARWTHIARMMSTDLGVLAGSPCQRCLNKVAEGWEEPCVVYSTAERERVGKGCVARSAPCLTANRTCGAKLEADGEEEQMGEEEGSEFEGSETPSPAVRTRTRRNAVAADRRTSRTKTMTPRGETVIYSDEEEDWEGFPEGNTGAAALSETKAKPKQDPRRRSASKAQKPRHRTELSPNDDTDTDDQGIVAKPRTPASRTIPTPQKQPQTQSRPRHTQSPVDLDNDAEEDEEIAVMRAEALAEKRARQVKAFAEQKALEDEAFAAETEARIARAMLEKSRKRKSWAMDRADS